MTTGRCAHSLGRLGAAPSMANAPQQPWAAATASIRATVESQGYTKMSNNIQLCPNGNRLTIMLTFFFVTAPFFVSINSARMTYLQVTFFVTGYGLFFLLGTFFVSINSARMDSIFRTSPPSIFFVSITSHKKTNSQPLGTQPAAGRIRPTGLGGPPQPDAKLTHFAAGFSLFSPFSPFSLLFVGHCVGQQVGSFYVSVSSRRAWGFRSLVLVL